MRGANDRQRTKEMERVAPQVSLPRHPRRGGKLADAIVLGSYRIEHLLGRGGMSRVYRGHHITIGRPVAVKILDPDVGSRRAMSRRFLREARLLSQVRHDNVVSVLDFGTAQGELPYLVMEYVPGQTLQDHLEQHGPLSWSTALDLVRQILRGLRAIHAEQIVHRDIKPDNCMLLSDPELVRLKLIDFGVAKSVAAPGPQITGADTTVGTPCYMSPEQVRGDTVDARSDLYAVGIVLFELLVGHPPFVADSSAEVTARQLRDEVPDVFAANPACDAPRAVTTFIRRAMAKCAEHRFSDADTMLAALDALDELEQTAPHAQVVQVEDLELELELAPRPASPLRVVREQGRAIAALMAAGGLCAAFAVWGPALASHAARGWVPRIVPAAAHVAETEPTRHAAKVAASVVESAPVQSQAPEPRLHRAPPLRADFVRAPAAERRVRRVRTKPSRPTPSAPRSPEPTSSPEPTPPTSLSPLALDPEDSPSAPVPAAVPPGDGAGDGPGDSTSDAGAPQPGPPMST